MSVHKASTLEGTMNLEHDDDFDPLDPEIEEERAKRRKDAEKQLLQDLKVVMGTKSGRRAIFWIFELCSMSKSVTSLQPLAMAIASGQRDIGLAVRARVETACPELLKLMEKEHRNG